ncbi:MAG: DUF1932 domain-containing protein [Pseudolysinimonas sp.]
MHVALLGLGEGGRLYAIGLRAAGNRVTAFDPVAPTTPDGVERRDTAAEAVADAELVLSLVGANAAAAAAAAALPAMTRGAVFADLNTMAPEAKAALAASSAAHHIAFADVAVMAPIPRAGVNTPLLVSGAGAERFRELFAVPGVSVRDVGETAGTAAGLKLLRSVFMKGLAALVFEATTAAEHSGSVDWIIDEMAGELGESGRALVDRLIEGTRQHAVRREHEMRDVEAYLEQLGSPGWMTSATVRWLQKIAEDGEPGAPQP